MIEVIDLTKRYGAVTALKGVSFSVPTGQVVGFLGPNGAGKTTTMKILTGYLAPTAGTAVVDGHDVTSDPLPAQRVIGYLPEGNPLYPDMRVEEALRFAAEMHGLHGEERDRSIDEAIESVNLEDKRLRTCGTMSRGERQRVGLAQALLHRPRVLILDEPTSGLDPNQQAEMRDLIRALGRERTVILSTHVLTEVEAVCDRALIVSKGTLVADGTVAEIRGRGRAGIVLVVRADATAAQAALQGLPGYETVEAVPEDGEPGWTRVRLAGPTDRDACARVAARLAERRVPLASLAAEVASLDRIFAELTTGDAGIPAEAGEASRA
jgi:ABC-2 type transport system ATP-binding protein